MEKVLAEYVDEINIVDIIMDYEKQLLISEFLSKEKDTIELYNNDNYIKIMSFPEKNDHDHEDYNNSPFWTNRTHVNNIIIKVYQECFDDFWENHEIEFREGFMDYYLGERFLNLEEYIEDSCMNKEFIDEDELHCVGNINFIHRSNFDWAVHKYMMEDLDTYFGN
jgi:hypothetical protein